MITNDRPAARVSRRQLLAAAPAAAAAGLLGGTAHAAIEGDARERASRVDLDLDDSATNVEIFARLTADIEPGRQGHVLYEGRAFGVLDDGRVVPFYGIQGLGSLKALKREGGAYGFLFAEFAIYTDLATGAPLERWANPVTGEEVAVWHQRNGPVNYEIHPAKTDIAFFTLAQKGNGFRLPWVIDGDVASFRLDALSNRPNALDPEQWPRESSGRTLPVSEHSQYFVAVEDLGNERLTSLPFRAALQSLKPWHPWMLMGQRPGKVYTTMTSRKVSGLDALSPAVAAYARRHLEPFTRAPEEWTGAYVTAYSIYRDTQRPAR